MSTTSGITTLGALATTLPFALFFGIPGASTTSSATPVVTVRSAAALAAPESTALNSLWRPTPWAPINVPSRSEIDSSDTALGVAELRETSGLTASQIARLFGVSRRSVNNWFVGRPMSSVHEERLSQLLATVRSLSGRNSMEKRAELLASAEGPSIFHQLLAEAPSETVLQVNPLRPREQF